MWMMFFYIDGLERRNSIADGLVQERRDSIAKELELRLPCTNPLTWYKLFISWGFPHKFPPE